MTTIVYTLPDCVQCDRTKKFLTAKGAPYQVVDLSTSPEDYAAVQALGYQAAPVVVVGNGNPAEDKHWYGFRPDLLKEFAVDGLPG